MNDQEQHMPKVSIRGNQLTLPDELRQALTTAEDDSIDAEEVDEGILLKPSPAARRKAAFEDIKAARAGVRYVGPEPRPSAEEEEQWIADVLHAEKLEDRAKRNQK